MVLRAGGRDWPKQKSYLLQRLDYARSYAVTGMDAGLVLDEPSALEGAPERHLVGVLEVAADRQTGR